MEKEFVPYELALRMKQLGFEEPCVAHWFNNVGIGIEFRLEPLAKSIAKTNISVYYELAPLYQQAFRWFREKYNLFGEINLTTKQEDVKEFEFFVLDINEPLFESDDYKKYKEAELACLEKLIEIVEKS